MRRAGKSRARAQRGGQRARLEVKLFGGATLGFESSRIGARDAAFAQDLLLGERLVPLICDLGGEWPRRLIYQPSSGRAFVALLSDDTAHSSFAAWPFSAGGGSF